MDCLQFVDTGIIEDIRYMQGAVENARLLEDLQATDCCSEDISDDVLDVMIQEVWSGYENCC